MSKMRTLFKGLAGGVGVLAIGAGGFYAWADHRFDTAMATPYPLHDVQIPVPWPLTEAEVAALRAEKAASLTALAPPEGAPAVDAPPVDPLAGVDLDAIARERAVERAKHLLGSRYGCTECHGKDLGGGKMVDDPALGSWYGPNLTRGKGSRTLDFTVSDWDHIVRHGVRSDGLPTVMPAVDHVKLSDQELSDIIVYAQSVPPVDHESPPMRYGPLVKVLAALGQVQTSASVIDHDRPHVSVPPPEGPTVEFGGHIAQTCVGCHNAAFTGGPIAGGDPSWPPAANLTPDATGAKGWTHEQFVTALRTGKRADGTELKAPMPWQAYAQMSDTELHALYVYFQSLPAKPKGGS